MRRFLPLTLIVLVAAGCGQAGSPGGQPSSTAVSSGSATPAATGTISSTGPSQPPVPSGAAARVWQLRYLLLGHYPNFAYCDPDLYPVARDDEQAADDWWAGADRGSPEVGTILAHRGYHEPLMTAQRLTVYRDHKELNVIVMQATSGGCEYELPASASGGEPDLTMAGLITLDGTIRERSRRPRAGGCPICLEADTRIATPRGDVPVARIRPGDVVWTVDANGRMVTAPVERVVRRPTPGPHLMLRLALSDGRVLAAAGAHPAADGTYLRQLRLGQRYDGATVTTIGWRQSTTLATFDLLPAGPTGDYWANGILVGSTLRT